MIIQAWLRIVNRNIMNLYQGLSMKVMGSSTMKFKHGV